jgi:catechol 2,3-dioxygenase-like lactoylglutathione lyase family enzyme
MQKPDNRIENRPRLVGINHVALEVGDIEEALVFYGQLFDLTLRGRHPGMAFIDLGDQFIALIEQRTQPPDSARHFGLVVDDREAVRGALKRCGIEPLPGPFLDFLDPWGNHVQIVQYSEVQFTKAPEVLKGMGLSPLGKSAEALRELEQKGMAPQ